MRGTWGFGRLAPGLALPTVLVAVITAAGAPALLARQTPLALEGESVVRATLSGPANATEHLLLSGEDSASPRFWSIVMATGPQAGREVPIAVPGQWETSGFGTYTYGHDELESADQGRYRMSFEAPQRWSGRRVELVFEGVMTDTTAFVNGVQVGPTHRGGYTEFRYDVTSALRLGQVNQLEVEVAERSENPSVNRAERDADYWVFGGIYRPVRLEILPERHISRVALDAKHDGTVAIELQLTGLGEEASSWWVDAEIVEGGKLEASAPVGAQTIVGTRRTKLVARASAFSAWSAETPHLGLLELRLRRGAEVVHVVRERFGFRTVDIAKHGRIGREPGIWINGSRVFLRGVNRHDSWPATGRAMARQRARADAELLLALGFNAVRMSHYPPSRAFLEACDELGLYVINELPGWHDAYDTEVGAQLVDEMVRRDVNHPSVILWANGNEGGWNRRLTQHFALHDPQRRPVLLPDEIFGGFDTRHYPSWSELTSRAQPGFARSWLQRLRRRPVLVMPTEMLHGLWDGGGGANLASYLDVLRRSERGAGFFLWAFSDEAVVRADRGGELDAAGNFAPDGIVGPWREWEASAFAVRELIAPVEAGRFDPGHGRVALRNRFDHTDLAELVASWRWIALPAPGERGSRDLGGSSGRTTSTIPRAWGSLEVGPAPAQADALELSFQRVFDGREIASAMVELPRPRRSHMPGVAAPATGLPPALSERDQETFVLTAGGSRARFDAASGELLVFERGTRVWNLVGGTRRADGSRGRVTAARLGEPGTARLELDFEPGGAVSIATWRLDASGALSFAWLGERNEGMPFDGVRFELPAAAGALSFEWVGAGPCPVWRNRLAGGRLGFWRQPAIGFGLGCSEARGFFQSVRWMALDLGAGRLLIEPEGNLFVGVDTPVFPADSKEAVGLVPAGGALTLLHEIPAIGTKFHPTKDLGPEAAPSREAGLFRGSVRLTISD